MSNRARKISHDDYYLSLVVEEIDEDELEGLAYDEDGEPVIALIRDRNARISGVRRRVPRFENEWGILVERKIEQKRFVVIIRYDYPMVVFPVTLLEEMKNIEEFFGISQRGEGSNVHEGRMLATLTYRLNQGPDVVRGFSKTIRELLERYGVEIINYEIART